MKRLTRRRFIEVSSAAGALLAGAATGNLEAQAGSFAAASNGDGPGRKANKGPGIQSLYALCEVTGGGKRCTASRCSTTFQSTPQAFPSTRTRPVSSPQADPATEA